MLIIYLVLITYWVNYIIPFQTLYGTWSGPAADLLLHFVKALVTSNMNLRSSFWSTSCLLAATDSDWLVLLEKKCYIMVCAVSSSVAP